MALYSLTDLGFGGAHLNTRLPKVLAELQNEFISGPLAGTTANTAITVTELIEYTDTIFKVINMTDLTDIALNTMTITDRRATGTLTVGAGIADGDVVGVNGKSYTFKAITVNKSTNIAPYIVPITLTDANGAAAALATAIMCADPNVVATAAGAVVTIVWAVYGTAGNAITLTVAASNGHVTRSAATLAGGTATNSIKTSVDTSTKKILVYWRKKA